MVQTQAYLLLGNQQQEKKRHIDAIKKQHLDSGLRSVDCETIDADDKSLTAPLFDETLRYLPLNPDKKRIVIIRRLEALRKDLRDILLAAVQHQSSSVIFILDSDELGADDTFVQALSPFVTKVGFRRDYEINVGALINEIRRGNPTMTLRTLHTLLDDRERPESILGALFWQWENNKTAMNAMNFKKGLKVFVDADLRMKTGKMDPVLALEQLVIQLLGLLQKKRSSIRVVRRPERKESN